MISAWEVRKRMYRLAVEHSVRNALEAASGLNEQSDGVARLALRSAEREGDPKHKAALLSGVARVLTEGGRTQDGVAVLLAALHVSILDERDTLMQVLTDGAMTLAAVDEGKLLWRLSQDLERLDDWFGG